MIEYRLQERVIHLEEDMGGEVVRIEPPGTRGNNGTLTRYSVKLDDNRVLEVNAFQIRRVSGHVHDLKVPPTTEASSR